MHEWMSPDQKIIGRVSELHYEIFLSLVYNDPKTSVGNMEDLFEKSEPEATAASHLSGLKILDSVLQIATAHSTTSL